MVFDASIFQNLGRGVTPIMGPMEIATQGQQLRNLANQGKIQDMQVQGLNRQAQNEQQLRDVMKQFGGDEERALTELRKVGTPQALDLHDKILTASENKAQRGVMFQKTYLEMSQKEQEAIDYATELVGNAARAVKAAPGEAQPQLWAQALDDLSARLQPDPGDPPKLGSTKAKMVQQMQAEKQALLTGQGALRLDEHINSSLTTKQWIEQAKEITKPGSDVGKIMADWRQGVYGEGPESVKLRDLAIKKATNINPGGAYINLGGMKPGESGFDAAVEATKNKLLTGQMPFPKGRELSDPVNNKAVHLARIEDPSFNEATHNERAKAWSNLSNGPIGKSNNAINTAIAHLGRLTDLYQEVSDSGMVGANHAMNWIKKNAPGGYPALDEAETVINAVGDELERVYTGLGSEGGRKAWREKMDPALPMASRMRNAIGLINLLEGKVKANTSQFRKAFGGIDPGMSVLTPESEETLNKIKSWAKGKKSQPSQSAPSTQTQTTMTATDSNGNRVMWNGSAWVPVK